MTNLTDRYVYATVRGLPPSKREDVSLELRASIADQVEARVASGDDPATAEHDVIAAMGDPMLLSASYAGRQLALIGPDVYPTWRRLLTVLLAVVTPIIALLAGVGAVVDKQSLPSVIWAVISAGFMIAIQLTFWITLVFAVLDRLGAFTKTGFAREETAWSPKDLPTETESAKVSRVEIGFDVAFTILAIVFLLYQSWWLTIDGQQMSILNPDLWPVWIPLLIASLVASVLLAIVTGISGKFTWTQAWVNVAIALLFVLPAVYLASTDQLLNPTFVAEFDWLSTNVATVNTTISLVVIVIWVIDVSEKFYRAWRAQQH